MYIRSFYLVQFFFVILCKFLSPFDNSSLLCWLNSNKKTFSELGINFFFFSNICAYSSSDAAGECRARTGLKRIYRYNTNQFFVYVCVASFSYFQIELHMMEKEWIAPFPSCCCCCRHFCWRVSVRLFFFFSLCKCDAAVDFFF